MLMRNHGELVSQTVKEFVLLRVVRLARVSGGPRALGLRTLRTALLDGVRISFLRRMSVNSILRAELTSA